MSACGKQYLLLDDVVFSGENSGRQRLPLTILVTGGFVPLVFSGGSSGTVACTVYCRTRF